MRISFVYSDTPRVGELLGVKQGAFGDAIMVVKEDGVDHPKYFIANKMDNILTGDKVDGAFNATRERVLKIIEAACVSANEKHRFGLQNPLLLALAAIYTGVHGAAGYGGRSSADDVQEAFNYFKRLVK